MSKRVRLTDDSLNSHGSRVLTSGVDISQYERNPVLLYMHERGKVIGYMKDIEVKDGEITGVPVFDCATELSKQCKKQWKVGSLRMVSIGIDVLELSEKPEHLVAGQTSPTITKSKIFETSIVDIGANDNAIVMRRNGKQITLGFDSENPLPRLNSINIPNQNTEMELKTFALRLGLAETADEATILSKIDELKSVKDENETLKREKANFARVAIETAVDNAISEKRINANQKDHFVKLGEQVGIESLKVTLSAITPRMRLIDQIDQTSDKNDPDKDGKYKKLSEVPEKELKQLRLKEPDEYRRLFKAEYGYDCEY